jgi:hypothetical protein
MRGPAVKRRRLGKQHLRVLVDKLGGIVDLIVDHHKQILLGVVLSNILVGEFERHVC